MADKEPWKREEEDEDEELDETDYRSQKDAILLAIQVSDSMLEPPLASDSKKADKDSALQAALKCAYQLMEQRIITQPKDMMGILFFGTEKSKFHEEGNRAGLGYPHCYTFTDLDIPAADDVKALKALAEQGEDDDEVLKPSTEAVQMSNVFFCANQIFTTKAANFGNRRLFIITDNDDPHPGDKAAKTAAAVRAKDLYDLGVSIELFPITRGDDTFDLAHFYDDIIYRDAAGEANHTEVRSSKAGGGLSLLNSLVSEINSRQTPKRALFSNVSMEIAPGLSISVKGYNILHRQAPARTCYVWLDGDQPQIAAGETTRLSEDSGKAVEKGATKKAYKFGGEYVYFSPEEQKALKDFGKPVIRIIGFKPRAMIPFWASVKKSTFIFPSEEDYVGSTRVFAALWKKLLDSKKVAIAWCMTRSNMNPVLVAVIPSKESSEEENGTPYLPAGLWLYPLPFADDLRDGPPTGGSEPLRASNELTDQMRTIVQQLQLPKAMYNPTRYPNPALQWHYKILQALALEEEVPEEPEDATLPKFKAIIKRAGGYLQDWDATLSDEVAAAASSKKKTKREAESDEEDVKPAKKTKTAAAAKPAGASGKQTNKQLREALDNGELKKMLVADLKNLLAERGESTTGKKAELLERLEQWLDANA
ncbi:ku70 protein [Plectosphaerella cucumerina]|uniref:ATP-dependent DNA helicase II subunit 1 n=1 Tax=Plectosphaerella cucumerina TaxID=40658 RepID=A0A8K0T2W0_9PEZI|nr:ku70 protein [Plectosphaerella cucumerina]